MRTVEEYAALPWTVQGRWVPEDGGYYLITIAELPGFSVVGESRAEAERELPGVLDAYLQACLDTGREIPTPMGAPVG